MPTIKLPRDGDVSRDGFYTRKPLDEERRKSAVRGAFIASTIGAFLGGAAIIGFAVEYFRHGDTSDGPIALIWSLGTFATAGWFIWKALFPFEWVFTEAGKQNERSKWVTAPVATKPSYSGPSLEDAHVFIGTSLGVLGCIVTFIGVYIAAVGSVGWVVGIALGWIPAGLASLLAYVILRYLWWVVALGIFALFASINNV